MNTDKISNTPNYLLLGFAALMAIGAFLWALAGCSSTETPGSPSEAGSVAPMATTGPFYNVPLCWGPEDHPLSADSTKPTKPCVWDALRLGNGEGTSFIYVANGGEESGSEVFVTLDGTADCVGSLQSLDLAVELCGVVIDGP